VLIGGNWLLFIWAVNNHHMLEASLGYFINPLVNIVLGMIFLGERFRRMQWLAVLLAFCGVLVQLWTFGSLPIIGLGLAFSFAFYGLVRKKIAVDAQTGMLFETLWLLPVAAIYLFGIADSPTSHMGQNPWSLNLLLMAAGVVTTIPLLCFTGAATRLRLSTLGFFQYIGPTLMFLLAVTFYGEVPGADKMVTFAFIWVALAIFVMDAIYTQRGVGLYIAGALPYPAYKSNHRPVSAAHRHFYSQFLRLKYRYGARPASIIKTIAPGSQSSSAAPA
jgi:chloramphenicol-sensitive protein RarD